MLRPVVLFALAACGRVSFDPLSDGGDGNDGDGDGDGNSTASCTATAEVCNGLDDNCDVEVDEGCTCTEFDTMTNVTITVDAQSVVWTGSTYVATYYTASSTTELLILDSNGVATSQPVGPFVASNGGSALAWTGTELLLASSTSTGVWLHRFDRFGVSLAVPIQVAPSSGGRTAVAWDGQRVLFAWTDNTERRLHRLDATGAPLGPSVMLPIETDTLALRGKQLVIAGNAIGNSAMAAVMTVEADGAMSTPAMWSDNAPTRDLGARGDHAAIASFAQLQAASFRAIASDGSVGPSVPLPDIGGQRAVYGAMRGTSDGYYVGALGNGAFYDYTLDRAGTVVRAPRLIGGMSFDSAVPPAAAVATGRSLYLQGYQTAGQDHLRAIQRCD